MLQQEKAKYSLCVAVNYGTFGNRGEKNIMKCKYLYFISAHTNSLE